MQRTTAGTAGAPRGLRRVGALVVITIGVSLAAAGGAPGDRTATDGNADSHEERSDQNRHGPQPEVAAAEHADHADDVISTSTGREDHAGHDVDALSRSGAAVDRRSASNAIHRWARTGLFSMGRLGSSIDSTDPVPWSHASSWPDDRVPRSGAEVTIPRGVRMLLDRDVSVAGLVIDGELSFHPDRSITLTSTANIEVNGLLRVKPADSSVDHTIRFVGVDESAFAGGGMQVIESDVGLWVMGRGQAVLEGAERRGWTNAVGTISAGTNSIRVEDATGWEVGDQIVVTPTGAPGADGVEGALTSGFHEARIAAIEGTRITLTRRTTRAHPEVAGRYSAEVMNLTRNVTISGSLAGRSHVLIHGQVKPQFFRWVALERMGVPEVQGRYPLHFHHAGDGSYGSLVEGVVVVDSGNRAFVPHMSNGITMSDVVAYEIRGEAGAYWWDERDSTHDLRIEHALSAATTDTGFFLGRGTNIGLIDAVAVGVNNRHNSGGFEWDNGSIGNWYAVDLVAHNNLSPGVRVWQNADIPQVVDGLVAYHNHREGIDHGAYSNRYTYRNAHFYGNLQSAIRLQATSSPTAISFQNVVIETAGVTEGSPVTIGGSAIPAPMPALFHDASFPDATEPIFRFLGGNPHQVVCSACTWPSGVPAAEFVEPDDSADTWLDVVGPSGSTRFLPSGDSSVVANPALPSYSDGNGIFVQYFDGPNLRQPRFALVVPGSSEGWTVDPGREHTGISPYHRLNVRNGSSMRWTGELEIPSGAGGMVRFFTEYPGGVRLWIDGRLLVDDWANRDLNGDFDDPSGSGRNTASIVLAPGRYQLRLEATHTPEDLESTYGGLMGLYWQLPGGDRMIIPGTQLHSPQSSPAPRPTVARVPR